MQAARGLHLLSFLKLSLLLVEEVANTDGNASIKALTIEASTAVAKPCANVRAIVDGEFQREPKIVGHAAMSHYASITSGIEQEACTSTNTEAPVPRALVVPRNLRAERVDPVVGASGTNAVKRGQFDSQIDHVGFAQVVLIRGGNAITNVTTDSARLRICSHNRQRGDCQNQE